MNYNDLERRWRNDPEFHAAVTAVERLMRDYMFTHQDLREIAFCAAMRQHSERGNGTTAEEALEDYCDSIAGKRIAVDAWKESRREFDVPKELEA